jgi:hypothetical protein
MTEAELRERLTAAPLPDEEAATGRAWSVVRTGRAQELARGRHHRRRRFPRAAVAMACVLLLAALALTLASRPREALARWLRQAIGLSSVPSAHRTTLAGLPGGGRLLVQAGATSWLVSPDGSRRLLGHDDGAELSPHERFVMTWRGPILSALTPGGRPQWSLTAPADVTVARWSTDGYRVAYLAGGSLRVLAGDGSGDHDLVDFVAPVPPAWEPGAAAGHRVALVRDDGAIELRDVDSGAVIWRQPSAGPAPHRLLWSPDGRYLLAVSPRALTLYAAGGRLRARWSPPAGTAIEQAAFTPGTSERLGLLLAHRAPLADSVVSITSTPQGLRAGPRLLLSLPERLTGLSVSPAGDWFLVSAPTADQWAAIRARAPVRLITINRVAGRFAPGGGFPEPVDWRPPASRAP